MNFPFSAWDVASVIISVLLILVTWGGGYLLKDEADHSLDSGYISFYGLLLGWVPVAGLVFFTLFPLSFWAQFDWRGIFPIMVPDLTVDPVMPTIWSQYDWHWLIPGALIIQLVVPFILYWVGGRLYGWVRYIRIDRPYPGVKWWQNPEVDRRHQETVAGSFWATMAFYLLVMARITWEVQILPMIVLTGSIVAAILTVIFCFFGKPRWPKRESANGSTTTRKVG